MTPRRPLALVALLLAGCAAQQPVLYPTDRLVREDAAIRDEQVSECRQLADANVPSTLANETLRETAVGGGIGAASGVVGGAIFGSPGTGAAVGAASGATASLLNRLFRSSTPNPTYQSYVSTCLSDRGYRVVGWQ
ncbi:MAG: glycine zipper family protein [Candidatus Binatia bacterium]